jgi:predicted Zn-dependent peptidase
MPSTQSASVGIWVQTGGRFERAKEKGLSHLIEHMVFKGTETRDAETIAHEIERVGGEINAYTTTDLTTFYAYVRDRDLAMALEVLSDLMLNPVFDPKELKKEQKVVLQEIAMGLETPEDYVYDLYWEKVFGKDGIGSSILGSRKNVSGFTRANILAYFKKHYRPENTIVSIAGNVTEAQVRKALDPLRKAKWPERSGPKKKPAVPFGRPKFKAGRWKIRKKAEQAHVVWGVPGFSYQHKHYTPGLVLAHYLGAGMSSLVYRELRERRGLAYSVYAGLTPFEDAGLFSVYVATKKAKADQCLEVIEELVQRMSTDKLNSKELADLKENLNGSLILGHEGSEARMTSNAQNEIFLKKHAPLKDVCRIIDQVTAEEVRAAAEELFADTPRAIMIMEPKTLVRR